MLKMDRPLQEHKKRHKRALTEKFFKKSLRTRGRNIVLKDMVLLHFAVYHHKFSFKHMWFSSTASVCSNVVMAVIPASAGMYRSTSCL